jgi:hypothetical protein
VIRLPASTRDRWSKTGQHATRLARQTSPVESGQDPLWRRDFFLSRSGFDGTFKPQEQFARRDLHAWFHEQLADAAVNLGVTARRPRLLIELSEAPAGLTYAQVLDRYNGRYQVEVRLERLLGSGQIVLRNGRYRIGKPVLLLVARIMVLLKRLLLGKSSEFA